MNCEHTRGEWESGIRKPHTGPTTPSTRGATVAESRYWRQHPNADSIPTAIASRTVVSGLETIAIVPASPHQDANVRLIAAAPRLLKACQTMLEAYRLIPVPDCDDEQSSEEYRGLEAARQNLINAIAKATTKEPSNGPAKVS